MKLFKAFLLSMLALPLAVVANAQEPSATEVKINQAIAHERRSEADKARDKNRKPLETLSFFGLEDDMEVLELLPGGGWYTSILGPVLEEKGKLYLSVGADRTAKAVDGKPGFSSVEQIPFDRSSFSRGEGERRFTVPEFSFGVRELDMVLTFRNIHNLSTEGRKNMNDAVFDALDSGGIYGIIDHTRRHMSPDYSESWRRMDPVEVIKEVEAAGFIFEDYSSLHYRADDELIYEVGRKSVAGNTDRFTLKFRKP